MEKPRLGVDCRNGALLDVPEVIHFSNRQNQWE